MSESEDLDLVIKELLNIALRKSEKGVTSQLRGTETRTYIGQLYSRITDCKDFESKNLSLNDLDDVVRAMLLVSILRNGNPMKLLNDAFFTCAGVLSNIERLDCSSFVCDFFSKEVRSPLDVKGTVETIQKALIANAALLMQCPLYFNLPDVVNVWEIKREYLNIIDPGVRSRMFLEFATQAHSTSFLLKTLNEVYITDENVAKSEFYLLFRELRSRLCSKPLNEPPTVEIKFMVEIFSFEPLVKIFLDWFIEEEVESPLKSVCGSARELKTFWGRLLSFTPLNEEIVESAKLLGLESACKDVKPVRLSDFHGIRDVTSLGKSFVAMRSEYEGYISQLLNCIKLILKSDTSNRIKLLSIWGRLISLNSTRRRISRMAQLDHPPIILDSLYLRKILLITDNNFGYCLNFMWILLLLAKGIPTSKIEDIDPYFCQLVLLAGRKSLIVEKEAQEPNSTPDKDIKEIEKEAGYMLGYLGSLASMGDEDEVVKSWKKTGKSIAETFDNKFITQIFWITLEGLGMLFLPTLQENVKLLVHTIKEAQLNSKLSGEQEGKMMEMLSYVYVWRCAVQHPSLISALWYYVNFSLKFFLRCALLYDGDGNVRKELLEREFKLIKLKSRQNYIELVELYCAQDHRSLEMSPQFTVLPVEMIETALEIIKYMTILRYYAALIHPVETGLMDDLDLELVLAVCIFLMMAPSSLVRNVHIGCDLVSAVIKHLCKNSDYLIQDFVEIKIANRYLVDGLTRCFVLSQRTSYNSRVSCRLHIIETLSQLFALDVFKKSFLNCITTEKEVFTQFLHLLLNDTTFLFEEMVGFLSEIRRRELAGKFDDFQESNALERENQSDEEHLREGAIDPNELKSMANLELKIRTKNLVDNGNEICSLLHTLCREFAYEISNVSVLLSQIASCLGCCLESLAGEDSLKLKVRNMQEYGFNPKDWLCKIMKCYISFYTCEKTQGTDKYNVEGFIKAIVQEQGRYYKPQTFDRCFRIAVREMFLTTIERSSFFRMSAELLKHARNSDTLYQNALESEIPEGYIDPIMMDIMEDPVLLPTSGKVMDRKNIERHLMSESTDPFTRAPLSKDQLIPQPELKAEIEGFMTSVSKNVGLIG